MRTSMIVAMLSLVASPAAAQRAELFIFAPTGEVDFEPAEDGRGDTTAVVTTEASLAAGFDALASPVQGAAIQAASAISIPLWLQTGITPSGRGQGASPGVPATFGGGGCAAAPYRIRGDLAASTEARRLSLYPLISQIACEAGLPVGLFDALVSQESRYSLTALSPKGAMGLTQLMPATARSLGVLDPWQPVDNLRGGARYLRQQLDEFGRVDLALAAYNAGPGRVRGRNQVPPIAETIGYVAAVTRAWSASFVRTPTLIAVSSPVAPLARRRGRVAELVAYTLPSVSNPM